MNNEQIIEMLKDIVAEIDYDISKEMFLEGYADPEDQKQELDVLVRLVKRHLSLAGVGGGE